MSFPSPSGWPTSSSTAPAPSSAARAIADWSRRRRWS